MYKSDNITFYSQNGWIFKVMQAVSVVIWMESELISPVCSVVLVADNWFKLKHHLMASISISNCRAKLWWFFIPVALLYDHTTVQWKESKWTRLKFGVQYTVTCVEKQFHTWPPCSTEVESAPLIHFQKLFWNKVFYRLKLVREFKFHIWMTLSSTHCLGMSYYVNFLGGLYSNEFRIKWRFGTHGSWKNWNPGSRFWATS